MTKKTVTPKMYALATIIFFVTMSLLLLSNLVDNEDSRKLHERKQQKKANLGRNRKTETKEETT